MNCDCSMYVGDRYEVNPAVPFGVDGGVHAITGCVCQLFAPSQCHGYGRKSSASASGWASRMALYTAAEETTCHQ